MRRATPTGAQASPRLPPRPQRGAQSRPTRKPRRAFRLIRNAVGNPDRHASPPRLPPRPQRGSNPDRRASPPRLQPSFTKRQPTRKPASLPALVRNAAGNPGRRASPAAPSASSATWQQPRPARKPAAPSTLIHKTPADAQARISSRPHPQRGDGREKARPSPSLAAVGPPGCQPSTTRRGGQDLRRDFRKNQASPSPAHMSAERRHAAFRRQAANASETPPQSQKRPYTRRQSAFAPGNQPHAARGVGAPGAIRAFCTAHRRPLIALKALARTVLCRTGPSHRGRRRPRRLAPTVTRRREKLEMPPHRH